MGRKPAHLTAAASSQDVIWTAIRAKKGQPFTRADLIVYIAGRQYTGISDHTVNSYVQRLERGGYLEIVKSEQVRGITRTNVYRLAKDAGVHAPRLDKNGNKSTQGTGRECMWRAMKIIGEFDARELAINASTDAVKVKENEAKDYVKHLFKAGYLHRTRESKPGRLARYKLLPSKNTGPRPPQVQRVKSVYDPNLAQVVWPRSHTEVRADELTA